MADNHAPTAGDYQAIKNTVAVYCLALDSKTFTLLEDVFTHDVDAKYPFPGGEMKGVEAVAKKIQERLTPVVTQHALTTQHIIVNDNPQVSDSLTACVTTYFTGVHLGQGRWAGQQVTAYGKYVDELVCLPADPAQAAVGEKEGVIVDHVPGASGRWRIRRREVLFMGRVGEEGVMTGE